MLSCSLCAVFAAAYHGTSSATRTTLLQHDRAGAKYLSSSAGFSDIVLTEDVAIALQVSTPLASQILFLSPLQAMATFRDEGTRDASSLPYAAMVVNGLAWCAYGLTLPTADLTIVAGNAGGVAFGLYYCGIFGKHMSPGSDAQTYFAGAAAFGAAILAAVVALPVQEAHELIGLAGVAFSVLMFSGPLASVQAILRDCSASSLPLGFTFATVLNCVLWATYGMFVIQDPLVWGPNVAGLVASATQLSLYAKYGENEEGCAIYD
jgi:lipid-A-disaccharide synthase-like uncharacterized protein